VDGGGGGDLKPWVITMRRNEVLMVT
jgi:hypothetical protein